jgi:hypothetical protein
MLTVTYLLLAGSFIAGIVGVMGKCPWWVSVLLLQVVVALIVLPK